MTRSRTRSVTCCPWPLAGEAILHMHSHSKAPLIPLSYDNICVEQQPG
jgi:hypothetical protein